MLHFQPVVPLASETVQRAADGMDAAHKEGQEQKCKKAYPLPFRQPPAEQPYPAVRRNCVLGKVNWCVTYTAASTAI